MPYDISQYSPTYGGVINSSGNVVNVADSIDANGFVRTAVSQVQSTATISNGGTTSNVITLTSQILVGLVIPSTYDGGNITLQGCATSNGTFVDIYDSNGNICTITIGGANRIVSLTSIFLQSVANVPYLKLKASNTVAADRNITILQKG